MSTLAPPRPRIESVPPYASSAGAEAIELAAMAGLELDPWQALVLEASLGERADGRWSAFEVGVNVARQNGKGSILEARELAGLFLLDERLIVHSAHEYSTVLEHQRRLEDLIDGVPEFRGRVKGFRHAHGAEGIELKNGQRLRFRTRTKSGGRGLSADLVVFDEAMFLPETAVGALMPTLSARPNPQVWYAGSAVDQTVMDHGLVFARVRERGLRGADPALCYFEWSADYRTEGDDSPLDPSLVPGSFARDAGVWAQANPALGIRISAEHVEQERRAMDPRTFAVERLGIGDWPLTTGQAASVIDLDTWRALADPHSAMRDPVVFAFDVRRDRGAACIGAAGLREDGKVHVEIVDQRKGTGWVIERLAELRERHDPIGVMCDASGPAASMAIEAGAFTLNTPDYAKACGLFYDLVDQGELAHLGTAELDAAIAGAARRPLVDAWAWSRKGSRVDISPLVAVTLAAWQARQSADVFLL